MNITDNVIQQAVSDSSESNIFFRDGILAGFGVRIYSSEKVSYFIEPTINGKSKRRVIGKYHALSVTEARALVTPMSGDWNGSAIYNICIVIKSFWTDVECITA